MSKPEPAAPRLLWVEAEMPGGDSKRRQALHLLARWLVSSARKGAPVAHLSPVKALRNLLDVGPEAKVGSDER